MTAESDEAFTAFVSASGPRLLRTAYLLSGGRQDAEDLLQDVLTRTYLAWPRVDPGAAETYVRVGLARAATSRWRLRRREILVAETPDRPSDRHDFDGERDAMWQSLQTLPPRQRAVLVLRYYDDLSEAEIAHALDCSQGTVKSQASKALTSLRKRIVPMPATMGDPQ